MKITFRELTEAGEVRALEPMVLEYFLIVSGKLAELGIDIPPEKPVGEMMDRLPYFVPPLGRAFVATTGGAPIAMAFLKPLEGQDVELKRLYVRDALRGTGLGRRLLNHTIDTARGLGMRWMYLDTIAPLKPAIRLYEAEGFEHVDAYAGSEISGYDILQPHAVYMRKAL